MFDLANEPSGQHWCEPGALLIEHLRRKNLRLSRALDSGIFYLAPVKIEERKRAERLIVAAAFCPFCGADMRVAAAEALDAPMAAEGAVVSVAGPTLYTDDCEYVAASSPEEAQQRWNERMGSNEPYNDNERGWSPMDRHEPFPYRGEPYAREGRSVTKTAGEWADEHPDFYACSET